MTNTPGQLFEVDHWRLPSNDPTDNTIDPNLKPFRRHAFNVRSEYEISSNTVVGVRYVRTRIDRAIEDTGTLTAEGEKYFIANPGFGITVDPKTWAAGIPVTVPAVTNYDGIEFKVERRFASNYVYAASYTYSRLWGNYSGLASADENGRTDPNVSRAFDLPWETYDSHGKQVLGLLPTDRPHTFKFFGSGTFHSKLGSTTFAPTLQAFSGTPLTTQVGVISLPVFVNGRGDLGRTPVFTQMDALLYHEFRPSKMNERFRFRIEANVTNLFNTATVIDRDTNYINANDGNIQFANEADFFKGFDYKALVTSQKLRVAPLFNLPSSFQGPRNIRFGFHFYF